VGEGQRKEGETVERKSPAKAKMWVNGGKQRSLWQHPKPTPKKRKKKTGGEKERDSKQEAHCAVKKEKENEGREAETLKRGGCTEGRGHSKNALGKKHIKKKKIKGEEIGGGGGEERPLPLQKR